MAGSQDPPFMAGYMVSDMKPILIIDYGMANLRSVQKAFEKASKRACGRTVYRVKIRVCGRR